MNMKEKLQEIREEAVKRIQGSEGLEQLNEVRVAYLGKKGQLTAVLKGMKDVAAEERPAVGRRRRRGWSRCSRRNVWRRKSST